MRFAAADASVELLSPAKNRSGDFAFVYFPNRSISVLHREHAIISTSISTSSSSASSGFAPQSSPVRYVFALSPITHHPKLLSVENLPPHLLARPIQTRTGVIHPALPVDYPMSRASSPSSPLRTTVDGVRLEITPTATLALNRPEIVIPASISPPSSHSEGSVPELDPDI